MPEPQDAGRYRIRPWTGHDDDALRQLMREQHRADPDWPPAYAWEQDLAEWLSRGTDFGRWVAIDETAGLVGHVGLGRVADAVHRRLLAAALDCPPEDLAEISRMVVSPRARGTGLASLLTRRALRTAIENGRFPVSNVSTSRGSWLDMMLATGWRAVGRTPSRFTKHEVVSLLPPERLVAAARSNR